MRQYAAASQPWVAQPWADMIGCIRRRARLILGVMILVGVVAGCQPAGRDVGLQQVDEYPLYSLRYEGDYSCVPASGFTQPAPADKPEWACTLFAAFGDGEQALGGRNFDWEFSPALLLFTQPSDGYASVSMVDAENLGLNKAQLASVTASDRRFARAPLLPFDGMNEYGLYVGMAAVPDSAAPRDPTKSTIGSLCLIREMLDHARDVEEAVALAGRYNVNFGGGPQIHYLVADRSGHSAAIEFKAGRVHVLRNERAWQVVTNFYLEGSDRAAQQACWRYTAVSTQLEQTHGIISPAQGMDLLRTAAQDSTQWSVLYDMLSGDVRVSMGRHYDNVHTFHLSMK